MPSNDELIAEFDSKQQIYTDFAPRLKNLITDVLIQNKISVHSVSCRVKDRASFIKKLSKKSGIGSDYESLIDITDIVGARIITYFEDDVKVVNDVIESEFTIDQKNSGDKRDSLATNEFGYLSVHYIATLNKSRSLLVEYRRFSYLKCEIQVRSILQHAWAEMEHDLGYKNEAGLPAHTKRSFALLAGALESSDREFNRIRAELEQYATGLPEEIRLRIDSVRIDRLSLMSTLDIDKNIIGLREFISQEPEIEIAEMTEEELHDTLDLISRILKLSDMHNLGEFSRFIESNSTIIKKFISIFYAGNEVVGDCTAVLLAAYYTFLSKKSMQEVKLFLYSLEGESEDIGDDFPENVKRFFDAYNQALTE